jgi:hypothetical protein
VRSVCSKEEAWRRGRVSLVDPSIVMLSSQLADAAVRNTASVIYNKITAARARRADQETIGALEEIIHDLISDKNELIQIAQALQDELTGQRIARSDVEYITEHLIPIIREFAAASDTDDESEVDSKLEALKALLSVETINILQLVGFNFKKAIGEPLTQLVSQLISSQVPSNVEHSSELRALEMKREIAYFNVVQDPESFERLMRGSGGGG